MKIYNVISLEEDTITIANARAFAEKEEAVEYAENLVKEWKLDNEDYEERREDTDCIYAFNDSYSISVEIKEQEV